MTEYQFVGLDFAFTDPRSVAASLRGCGNGLAENYDRFYEKMHRRYPLMTLEAINHTYHLKRQRIDIFKQRMRGALRVIGPYIGHGLVLILGTTIGFSLGRL
jgi:hypothetical protein